MPVLQPIRVISFHINERTQFNEKMFENNKENKRSQKSKNYYMITGSCSSELQTQSVISKIRRSLPGYQPLSYKDKKPTQRKTQTEQQLNFLETNFSSDQPIELIVYSDDRGAKQLYNRFAKDEKSIPANIKMTCSSGPINFMPIKGEGAKKQAQVKNERVLRAHSNNVLGNASNGTNSTRKAVRSNTSTDGSENSNSRPERSEGSKEDSKTTSTTKVKKNRRRNNSKPRKSNKSNNVVISKENNIDSNQQQTSTALMQSRLVKSSTQNIQKNAGSVPQSDSSPLRSDDDDLFSLNPNANSNGAKQQHNSEIDPLFRVDTDQSSVAEVSGSEVISINNSDGNCIENTQQQLANSEHQSNGNPSINNDTGLGGNLLSKVGGLFSSLIHANTLSTTYHGGDQPTWLQKNGTELLKVAVMTIGFAAVSGVVFFGLIELLSVGTVVAGFVAALYFFPTLLADVGMVSNMICNDEDRRAYHNI